MTVSTRPQKVETLTSPPIVGEKYLVPGIVVPVHIGAKPNWYPVLGIAHEDKEYIKASKHFHYDVRFFPADFFPLKLDGQVLVETAQEMMVKIAVIKIWTPLIEYREVVCAREMPNFPSWLAPWFPELQQGYLSKQLPANLKCPHQGIYLGSLPQVNGIVTCPGHGLKWNIKTGEAVK